jgi:hypothetical protein
MTGMVENVLRGLAVLGLFWVTACGGDNAGGSPAPGGTGGNTGTGGAGGQAGAATATGGTAPTQTSACREYVRAFCQRQAECGGFRPPAEACLAQGNLCPDLFFSPGSTRTIESMLTCATAFATRSCEDQQRGIYPPCATPGTLPTGAACMFHSQCASAECSLHARGCGTCLASAEAGAACQTGVSVCPQGYACTSGTCTETASTWTEPTEVVDYSVTLSAGTACSPVRSSPCAAGLSCIDDPNDSGDAGTCQIPPGIGQSCGFLPSGVLRGLCAQGAYCDSSLTCRAGPGNGQACVEDSRGVMMCGAGLYCISGTCQPLSPQGGACAFTSGSRAIMQPGNCDDGLVCGCTDATCSSGSCVTLRSPGQSCGEANTRCELGSECRAAECVFTDQVTLFAAACSG